MREQNNPPSSLVLLDDVEACNKEAALQPKHLQI